MMTGTTTRLFALAALTILLAAAAPNGANKSVSMQGMKFTPETLDIKVGDTVVWTNSDDRDHTVVAQNGAFKSDNLRPGKSFSFQFTKAGTFAYSCTYHPRMKGTIQVSDAGK